jgi:hypothetical protein
VARQQFRLVLGDLGEVAFKRFSNTGVQRAPWLAQQGAKRGVLNESVLEQIGRMRRHALPK